MATRKGHFGRRDFVLIELCFPIILFNKEKNERSLRKDIMNRQSGVQTRCPISVEQSQARRHGA